MHTHIHKEEKAFLKEKKHISE